MSQERTLSRKEKTLLTTCVETQIALFNKTLESGLLTPEQKEMYKLAKSELVVYHQLLTKAQAIKLVF